jgi:hypothetical protein
MVKKLLLKRDWTARSSRTARTGGRLATLRPGEQVSRPFPQRVERPTQTQALALAACESTHIHCS